MKRHAVHLTSDIRKAWESAERWSKTPVVIRIAAREMQRDGYRFGVPDRNRPWGYPRISINGQCYYGYSVWLTEEVPVKYFHLPVYTKGDGKTQKVYLEINGKEIKHIPDVLYGHPLFCLVDNFCDYNRGAIEDDYFNYNGYSDTELLELEDFSIHSILNIDALVRITRLAPERLTAEQYEAAENKLKDKVLIDKTDVNYILGIIRSIKHIYCLISDSSFYVENDISAEEVASALHGLKEDEYVSCIEDEIPRYIGDLTFTFRREVPIIFKNGFTVTVQSC